MKVLLAHNYYRHPGGEDSVFHRERQMLKSAGHQVLEYTRHNGDIVEHGILGKADLAARTLWAWDTEHQLAAMLRQEKPHVAHFHNTFPLISPAAYYACQRAGVPVVQSLHNARLICPGATLYRDGKVCQECLGNAVPWPGIVHACYQGSLLHTTGVAGMLAFHRLLGTWRNAVDAYIVFTEFFRKKFIAAGVPQGKIFLKPHFLPTDPGLRQERGSYALYVGRLAPEKGIRTVLQAWKLIGNSIPLHIVGDGPDSGAFMAFKEQARLANVYFHGWLAPEETLSLLKEAAFLIFPSESYETFGLAIIEAFACGVGVIVSRLGAASEIVESGKTGLSFTPGDAQDLAAKVEWALRHPQEMEELGRAGRVEYEAKYTADRNYQLLMEIYSQVRPERVRKAA